MAAYEQARVDYYEPLVVFTLAIVTLAFMLLFIAAIAVPRFMTITPCPTGHTGEQGDQGKQGFLGQKGVPGITGPFSVISPTGPTGVGNVNTGPPGPTGPPNNNPLLPGPTGDPGPMGESGADDLASQLTGPILVPSFPWPVFNVAFPFRMFVGDWRAPLDYYEEFSMPIQVTTTNNVPGGTNMKLTVLTFVRLGNRVTMGILPILFRVNGFNIGKLVFDAPTLATLSRFWTTVEIRELIPVMFTGINKIGIGLLKIGANGSSMTVGVGIDGAVDFDGNPELGIKHSVYVTWNRLPLAQ